MKMLSLIGTWPIRCGTFAVVLVLFLTPFPVDALTIDAIETGQSGITFTFTPAVPVCPGGPLPCQRPQVGNTPEDASVTLQYPNNAFTANFSADAILLEPVSEFFSGLAISDRITVSVLDLSTDPTAQTFERCHDSDAFRCFRGQPGPSFSELPAGFAARGERGTYPHQRYFFHR